MNRNTDPPPGRGWGGEQSRVFGISCPWSGDEHDPTPWTYWWWFRLYRTTQVVRHWLGWHKTRVNGMGFWSCDWCGYPRHTKRRQRRG